LTRGNTGKEPSAIRIAPLQQSERARWVQLWSEYQRFYGVELPAAVTEATWRRLHEGRVHGLGARDPAGHLIGIVHYLYHEDTWSTVPACYLQDLYVDPAARGTGCGRMLIAPRYGDDGQYHRRERRGDVFRDRVCSTYAPPLQRR
jgi:GNAT superfamily N-acetyltransferase